MALEKEGEDAFIHNLEIFRYFPEMKESHMQLPRLHYKNRKIYIAAVNRVAIVDLSSPDNPNILEVLETGYWTTSIQQYGYVGKPRYEIRLPALPGLSPRERLEAWVDLGGGFGSTALDGSLLLLVNQDVLGVYEVVDLNEERADLVQVGRRNKTPLERFWQSGSSQAELVGGVAYLAQGGGLSLYDVQNPTHPKRIGHYQAPTDRFRCFSLLEDGRVLAGGNNLHLLAPVRGFSEH